LHLDQVLAARQSGQVAQEDEECRAAAQILRSDGAPIGV
jgi:hypothetical protein